MCSDVFGPKFGAELVTRGTALTMAEYGGLAMDVTKVVFVHGSLDPWHALGITQDLSPSAPAILIEVRYQGIRDVCVLNMTDMTIREPLTAPTSTPPPRLTPSHSKTRD